MSISFQGRANQQEIISLLSDLVRINSINPFTGTLGVDGGGEQGMIEYISRYFDAQGIPYTLAGGSARAMQSGGSYQRRRKGGVGF